MKFKTLQYQYCGLWQNGTMDTICMALMPKVSWVISAIYCGCLLILQKSSLHTEKHFNEKIVIQNCWGYTCRSTDSIQQSFIQKYHKILNKASAIFNRSSTETFFLFTTNHFGTRFKDIYCTVFSSDDHITSSSLKSIHYLLFTKLFTATGISAAPKLNL